MSRSESTIQIVVPRKELFPNCPICHDLLKPNTAVAACAEEHAFVHADCRELSPRCPSMGCSRPLRVWNPDSHIAPLSRSRATSSGLSGRGLSALIAVFAVTTLALFASLAKGREESRRADIHRLETRRTRDQLRTAEQRVQLLQSDLRQERSETKSRLRHRLQRAETANKQLNSRIQMFESLVTKLRSEQRTSEREADSRLASERYRASSAEAASGRLAETLRTEREAADRLKAKLSELETQKVRLQAHLRSERQKHYRARQMVEALQSKLDAAAAAGAARRP